MTRCDDCGADIPPGEEVHDTRSEQSSTPSRWRGNTRTVSMTICRGCARKRGPAMMALKLLGPIFAAIALVGIIGWTLGR
jgi:hypothetical protein